jgi:hypothetical protein
MKPLILHVNATKPDKRTLIPFTEEEKNKVRGLRFYNIFKEKNEWQKDISKFSFIKYSETYKIWYRADDYHFIGLDGKMKRDIRFLFECESFDDSLYYLETLASLLLITGGALIRGGGEEDKIKEDCFQHLSNLEDFTFGNDVIFRKIATQPYNFYNFYKISQKFKQYLKENAKRLNCGFDMDGIQVDDQIELLEMGFKYKPKFSILGYSHLTIDVFSGKDYKAEYRTKQFGSRANYFLGDYDKLLNYLIEKKDENFIRFLKDLMKKFPEDVPEFQIQKFKETIKKLNIIPSISRDEFISYIENGKTDLVKIALDNKIIELSEKDSYLLFEAVQRGHIEIVGMLLKNPKIDVNYKNCKSLIYAAYYDYEDIVKILLSRPEIVFEPNKVLKYADGESLKLIKDYLKKK